MIDNLTDSIRHYKQKAQTLREYAEPFAEAKVGEATKKYIERCLERAEYNEQLASWLEELAEWRKLELVCANKGIFVYRLKESEDK